MELDDVVRKIKKLLAIAEDPSASDQEIQLAAYRAEKLMFKYKLDRKDIIEKDDSSKNVEEYYFEKKYTAYLVWTYNSDSYVNDLLIHTLSRYMMPVPILFIGYLFLEPVIKELLKKYLPLIFMFLTSIGIFYLVIRFF